MNSDDMFLTMILANAKRAEASALIIAAEPLPCRVGMVMPDGECKPFPTPPELVLRGIIARLQSGEREFSANVYSVTIEDVDIEQSKGRLHARISRWSVETS